MTVHGYGVLAQVYLGLPRPSVYDCDSFWQYSSIASLTSEFLRSASTSDVCTEDYDEIPKCARKKLELDGWIIINYNVSSEAPMLP